MQSGYDSTRWAVFQHQPPAAAGALAGAWFAQILRMQLKYLFLGAGFFASSVIQAAQPVHFLGNENLPPYIWQQDGRPIGLVVDLARAVAQKQAIDARIETMECSRAQSLFAAGKADALLHINQTAARERL